MAHRIAVCSTLAAAAALALAAPGAARNLDSWEISASGKSCTMLSTFADDMSVGLILSAPNGDLAFMAAGDGLAKAAGHPGAKVSVTLKFDGQVAHNEWTDEGARVIPAGDGKVAVIADWGSSLASELAATVSASKAVSISVAGKPLGSYDVTGSPAAYEELKRCGSRLAAN